MYLPMITARHTFMPGIAAPVGHSGGIWEN
jgi:hypothetical protein